MPCGGCAKRREAIKTAWHRVKSLGLMSNAELRAGARVKEREQEQQRQRDMLSLTQKSKRFG